MIFISTSDHWWTFYQYYPSPKEKMSQNRKGKKFSELHKQRLSQALTGRKQSVEAKEKMKSAWVLRKAKGIKRNNLGRFIISEPQEEFDQRYAA